MEDTEQDPGQGLPWSKREDEIGLGSIESGGHCWASRLAEIGPKQLGGLVNNTENFQGGI